jgi:adenylylsulfate kinase
MKILVMGLPGAGKTTFAAELVKRLNLSHSVSWYNADVVRETFDDWDFSPAGRQRQVERMRELSCLSKSDFVICDFVCPTDELRDIYAADIVIWMDTIQAGRFDNTNRVFVPPVHYTYRVTDWTPHWGRAIAKSLVLRKNKSVLIKIYDWLVQRIRSV